jgi:hypothetical protein
MEFHRRPLVVTSQVIRDELRRTRYAATSFDCYRRVPVAELANASLGLGSTPRFALRRILPVDGHSFWAFAPTRFSGLTRVRCDHH